MRSWSFRLTTIAGTEVRIHFTFLLLLVYFFWLGASHGGLGSALETMAFIVAVFTCVLLHEFGHVTAARRYGILTPDITLLPIGGVARLERMPREPAHELLVAICGPLVNIVIASVLYVTLLVLHLRMPTMADIEMDLVHGGFLTELMVWNLFMVAFNMIPAFPMDGGRVLRAVLALFMDYGKATRTAASIGQIIAVFAFVAVLFRNGNPLLLIIALFIFMSAGQEASMVTQEETTRGLRVRDAMVTDFHTLGRGATLQEAVALMLKGTQHDFPVVDSEGRFVGLLPRQGLIGALAEHGLQYPAVTAMQPCETTLQPMDDLNNAMQLLRTSSCPILPVLDPLSERLVGLLTTENIGEMMMVRAALTNAA
jgi:stage IV sporulation protein FB